MTDHPPFPVPPGQAGEPGFRPTPPTGALSWGLGLLALSPLPGVGSLAASVAMLIASRSTMKYGGLARANAVRAGNWALTYLILTVVLVGTHFGLLFALREIDDFFPFGFIILTWVAISLVHVVVSIIGVIQASRNQRVRVNGFPFFR